ncbi:MAG TPA: alkaline phosphatase family protein, partial [Terriglobales bacterium]|nr:alkaline phosphatase family protein [Terriglobales bacterium]
TLDHGYGSVPLAGSVVVSPPVTTTYTVTVTDSSGAAKTGSVTVNVGPNSRLNASIRHIVFMVQENHTFDSYFGQMNAYRDSRGISGDVDAVNPATVLYDEPDNPVSPYHFRTVCSENISTNWTDAHIAVDNGLSNDFMKPFATYPSTIDPWYHRVMGYYDQGDLPYYYELAAQFGTSDRWFSPVLGPTIVNRMYLFTGTSFGHIHPEDAPPAGGWPQKTIFDLLDQHGISWRYYYQDNSVFLAQFATWQNPAAQAKVRPISEYFRVLGSATADQDLAQVIFIERPAVSELDEHPGSNVQFGAQWASTVIDALLASPAWPSSALLLTWDEGGGFYDHVPPAAVLPPDNIAPMFHAGDWPGSFANTGFRVPVVVISPWARPHYVSHTVRDYTSILKLIEVRFGLPPLTWRDGAAEPMLEFFDFGGPAPWLTPPLLPLQPTDGVCDVNQEIG